MLKAIERTRLIANQFGLVKTANYATTAKMTDTSKYKFNHSMLRYCIRDHQCLSHPPTDS